MRGAELARLASLVPDLETQTRILLDNLIMAQRTEKLSFIQALAEIGDDDLEDGKSMPIELGMLHACAIGALAIQELASYRVELPPI